MKIDLHTHSTFSDGTNSPEEILNLAESIELEALSITDHDYVGNCFLSERFQNSKVKFIPGIELSCGDEFGKYHILGYKFNDHPQNLLNLTKHTHEFRIKKTKERLQILKEQFKIDIPETEAKKLLSLSNPGKPHIANLLVSLGYVKTIGEAFDLYLNKLNVKLKPITPEEGISAIKSDGGIPVLAHPILGDGRQYISGDELKNRVQRLCDMGLCGLEVFYSTFNEDQRQELLTLCRSFKLVATAGSDFHGKNKTIPFGKTNLAGSPPELLEFFDMIKI